MTAAVPGMAALIERAGLPLPTGGVTAHTVPAVVVGTPTAHPADLVQVLLRRAGPAIAIRALREVMRAADPVQWFRHGCRRWSRGGRRVPRRVDPRGSPDRDPAGRRVVAPAPRRRRTGRRAHNPIRVVEEWPSTPRFAYGLEFFAALTVNWPPRSLGRRPRAIGSISTSKDGRVRGPHIDAVVERRGGDWMRIRPDGIGAVDIKITYRTRDGAVILEQARGVLDLGPDGYAMVAAAG